MAALVLCTGFIQWQSGAYTSDLASSPDEPAHVVSGLMVHDYLAQIFTRGPTILPESPMAFAEAYAIHYPKVAIGHWPPLFYGMQAVWMSVLGRTKTALLLLILVVTAAAAILIRDVVYRLLGDEWISLGAAACFLLLDVTQESLFAVLPDALLAFLAALGARLACDYPRKQLALWMTAIAAVLVHARGLPLLLLPMAVMVRDQNLKTMLRQRSLWIALGAFALLAAPWLLFVRQTGTPSLTAVTAAIVRFPLNMEKALGLIPLAMMACGAVVAPYRKDKAWVAITAVVLGTWAFMPLALVPWSNNYLIVAVPACIFLMTCAWQWLGMRIAPLVGLEVRVIVSIAAVGTAITCIPRPPVVLKPNANYEAAARQILAGPDAQSTVYLVAGDTFCEGAFIAAVDLADRPGRHIVLRSTKVLSTSGWSGDEYVSSFRSPAEIADFLATSPISVVVIQGPVALHGPFRPDVQMLKAALRQNPSWLELPGVASAQIYRRIAPLPPGPIKVRLDMRNSLHKVLEWTQ